MSDESAGTLQKIDEVCSEALKAINLFPPGDDLVRRVEALAGAAKAFKEEWESKVQADAQADINANLGVFAEIRGMVERSIGREVPAGISPAEAVGLLVAELDTARASIDQAARVGDAAVAFAEASSQDLSEASTAVLRESMAEIVRTVQGLSAERDEARAALAQACKVIDDRGICERDASAPLPDRLDRIIVDLRTDRHHAEMDAIRLRDEVERVKAAVQTHHDQAGDDRCHLDDLKLYHEVLGEGVDPYVGALPPDADMEESCRRYIQQRRCPGGVVPLPEGMTIRQLTDEVNRLRSVLAAIRDAEVVWPSKRGGYMDGETSFDFVERLQAIASAGLNESKSD